MNIIWKIITFLSVSIFGVLLVLISYNMGKDRYRGDFPELSVKEVSASSAKLGDWACGLTAHEIEWIAKRERRMLFICTEKRDDGLESGYGAFLMPETKIFGNPRCSKQSFHGKMIVIEHPSMGDYVIWSEISFSE